MKIITAILVFCFPVSQYAQNPIVSGYVRDAETREVLIGANVHETESGKGKITNSYGFYSLALPKGKGEVNYSFLGYENVVVKVAAVRDTTIHIYLRQKINEISEVIIRGDTELKNIRLGTVDVPISKIQNTPALLGETDLMKSLQFIPGVQNTAEGKSDLSVRGGSPDQNLILLDGIPIYNPNHIFGFLSVFNTDVIKKVTLYKSGFPARFGGRLSSVIDVMTKDGNKECFSGVATIGLPTVKINLEGPIVKDRTSFTFSARRTYFDLLMKAFINDDSENTNLSFYDINAKIHHKMNDNTNIYLSAYNGHDKLKQDIESIRDVEHNHSASSEKWNWGNTIVTGRLSKVINPGLFFKTALTYNRYHYKMTTDDEYMDDGMDNSQDTKNIHRNFLFSSGIQDYSISGDFDYFPAYNHLVKYGMAFIFHDFNPEVISISTESSEVIKRNNVPKHTYSKELGIYAEDDWDITPKIRLNAGLRFSFLHVDKTTYNSIDPRLSLSFLFSDRMTVQAGYTLMRQYVHLLSSNSIVLQTDLWVPTTSRIKPMKSGQYSLGMCFKLSKSLLLSLESYYKNMENVIEYKDGINYTGVSAGWENKVEAGRGRSYGIELSIEKKEGRFTGIASYTLSKSERKFDEINFGEWFPAKYDHRHVSNLSVNYKLNEKIDITALWTYHSGDRITLPLMTYVRPDVPDTDGSYIPDLMQLDRRNNYQLKNYHRLDAGLSYTFAKKKNRYCMFNVSVYNVYCRMNPYKIMIESELHTEPSGEHTFIHSLKQITLFPTIPAFSFSYYF